MLVGEGRGSFRDQVEPDRQAVALTAARLPIAHHQHFGLLATGAFEDALVMVRLK